MSEERLQEIKDSVNFQREILLAHNMGTLCVDEEQELIEEIERLKEELKYTIPIVEHNQTIQSNINSYNKLAEYSKELEDRINKAIEYIEDRYHIKGSMTYDSPIYHKDLLDILKGEDKE